MKKVAFLISASLGFAMIILILAMILLSPPNWMVEHLPELYYEHSDWVSVWLSVLAVVISLYTAIVANFISHFSFDSSIAMPILSQTWEINNIPEMKKLDLIWNNILPHLCVEESTYLSYYRIELELEGQEMPLLNYELQELTFGINNEETAFQNNIYAEIISESTNRKLILHIISNTEKELKILTLLSEPTLFPYEVFSDVFVKMRFNVKATSVPYQNYMLVNLDLKKDESRVYKIIKKQTSFEKRKVFHF